MVGEVAVQLVASLRSMMSVKDISKHFGIARSTYYRSNRHLPMQQGLVKQ
ncbi:hypothetical protein LSPH24S_04991 [Lysinibacillus sphaericus]